MNINVLYEDNHLLIVEKPVNVPVQGDVSKDDDLLNILKRYIKDKYSKPGDVFLGLVHRLDRPVGGAIIFARTSKAASRLSNELRKNKIYRTYLAVTRGHLPDEEGTLTNYLHKNRDKNITSVVSKNNKEAKKAILNFKVLKRKKDMDLVQVDLETGRSHQIRVQFAHQNTPLYGDQKYGKNINRPGEQIALWSSQLSVKHPTKDEMVTVNCPPPDMYPWNELL